MNNLLGCFLGVVLLSGCSALTGISPEYPEGWPPTSSVQNKACPDLSGRYENLATYSFLPKSGANSLAFRLGGVETDVEAIALGYYSNTLLVEAFHSMGTSTKRILSKENGDFSCSEGAFVLPVIIDKDADGTGAYRSESRLYLRRAQNGALIGEERLSGIGAIIWLVPVGGWQTFWFQWSLEK